MDPTALFQEKKEEKTSPSQDPKLERESVDDFEHITRKEVSPMSEPNLQFINFEKGQSELKDLPTSSGDMASFEANKIVLEPTGAEMTANLLDLESDSTGSSKNFMQYEKTGISEPTSNPENIDDFLKGDGKSTPDILEKDNESDLSQADDDSIVEPLKGKDSDIFKDVLPEEPVHPVEPLARLPTPEPPKGAMISEEENLKKSPPGPDNTPAQVLADLSPISTKIEASTPPRDEPKELTPPPKVPEHGLSDREEAAPPPAPLPRDYPEIGVLEPREILCAFGLYTWFHPERLNPKVEALIYWRDPKKSGIVFGSVFVVLLSLTLFSLISVVAYTAITVLVAATSFRIYKSVLQAVQKTSEGHPFNTYLLPILENPTVTALFQTIEEYLDLDLTLSPERVREVTDVAVSHLNTALSELRRRFLVEDLVDSLKFGVFLYVLTYVGAWFNGLTLIILAFIGLFTLPKVYENNQAQIDANLDQVRAKINEVTDKIKAVIPIGKKSEEPKNKEE